MSKNEFEKVDSIQPDALTLVLSEAGEELKGQVHCPASATGGRLPKDFRGAVLPAKEAVRAAVKMANDMKLPMVVLDPQERWLEEWGTLYVTED